MKLCVLKLNSHEKKCFTNMRRQIFACMLVNIALLLIIFITDITRYKSDLNELNIGKYILFYIPMLLISFGILHYVSYLITMKNLFTLLNTILYKIAELSDVPDVSQKNIFMYVCMYNFL